MQTAHAPLHRAGALLEFAVAFCCFRGSRVHSAFIACLAKTKTNSETRRRRSSSKLTKEHFESTIAQRLTTEIRMLKQFKERVIREQQQFGPDDMLRLAAKLGDQPEQAEPLALVAKPIDEQQTIHRCHQPDTENEAPTGRKSRKRASPDSTEQTSASKPEMEKKRRKRINECLETLKDFVLENNRRSDCEEESALVKRLLEDTGLIFRHNGRKNPNKLEKVDILELTVDYIIKLHNDLREVVENFVMPSKQTLQQTASKQSSFRASIPKVVIHHWLANNEPAKPNNTTMCRNLLLNGGQDPTESQH